LQEAFPPWMLSDRGLPRFTGSLLSEESAKLFIKPLPGGALAFDSVPFDGMAELLGGLVVFRACDAPPGRPAVASSPPVTGTG